MTDFAQPLDGPPLSVIEPTALLLGYLDWYREALQRKLTGLSEDQLRTPLLPSAGSSTDPPVNEPSGRLVCRDHLVLEGHGLVLREWAVGDVEALIALYDTEEMALRTPVAAPFDVAAAEKYVRDANARRAAQTSLQLAVTEDGS